MKMNASIFANVLEHLKDGAFGVLIKDDMGGVLIERVDRAIGVEEVADLIGFTPSTIRAMARKGLLHPLKSKGLSGNMRFRKSRLIADMARLEEV